MVGMTNGANASRAAWFTGGRAQINTPVKLHSTKRFAADVAVFIGSETRNMNVCSPVAMEKVQLVSQGVS